MSIKIIPRLRRSDVVFNSFGSCVPNASEELSRTPEMSFSEVIPQPRMLVQKFICAVPFKQLKSFADAHCWGKFDKQVDMVNSDVKFVDFTPIPESNFIDKSLTIHSDSIKLKGVPSIFRFPDKMEGILSEAMTKALQIHFLTPNSARSKVHTKFVNLVQEGNIYPLLINNSIELNIGVGSPPKLKSMGIRAY